MSRRTERVGSAIREVLSEGMRGLSDPRVSPLTSITRVQVSGDLMHATVYVTVMGDEAEERKTLTGLQHARGFLQSMLAAELTTRQCPQLRFELDKGLKKEMETLAIIDQISEELRQTDAQRAEAEQESAGSPEESPSSEPDRTEGCPDPDSPSGESR